MEGVMKEDVLEQIVDDYLQYNGYFTVHNVYFSPRRNHPKYVAAQDRVPSDLDVLGLNPKRRGTNRVWAISCKAWQSGFDAPYLLDQLRGKAPNPKRPRWMQFRELWVPKWAEAFRAKVEDLTGATAFHYSIAVTRLDGDPTGWQTNGMIRRNLRGNPLSFLTLEQMWTALRNTVGLRPAPSEIGRLTQLLKAAGLA